MLRPGGVIRLSDVVYGFDVSEAPARVESWCAAGGDDIEGEWLRWEFEEHVRDEHSTFTWLLEPMLERVGFVIEDRQYDEAGFMADYVARRPQG